mmetsp:Transcript_41631/g.54835  ORF Transcript_41631/g.54835 Transcript_41631/m.54835 type:complete len:126 (+) Transcript_41631:421-798(+)
MGVALMLWLDLKHLASHNTWLSIIWGIGTFVMPLLIGYSRLYLGVHSLNQVTFGLQLGAWCALTAHYLIREPLQNFTQRLIDGKEDRNVGVLSIAGSAALVFILFLQTVIFEIMKTVDNPKAWQD